jgi:hypothetical protein
MLEQDPQKLGAESSLSLKSRIARAGVACSIQARASAQAAKWPGDRNPGLFQIVLKGKAEQRVILNDQAPEVRGIYDDWLPIIRATLLWARSGKNERPEGGSI